MKNEFYEQFKAKLFADMESIIAMSIGIFREEAYSKIDELLNKYNDFE